MQDVIEKKYVGRAIYTDMLGKTTADDRWEQQNQIPRRAFCDTCGNFLVVYADGGQGLLCADCWTYTPHCQVCGLVIDSDTWTCIGVEDEKVELHEPTPFPSENPESEEY